MNHFIEILRRCHYTHLVGINKQFKFKANYLLLGYHESVPILEIFFNFFSNFRINLIYYLRMSRSSRICLLADNKIVKLYLYYLGQNYKIYLWILTQCVRLHFTNCSLRGSGGFSTWMAPGAFQSWDPYSIFSVPLQYAFSFLL